MVKHTPRKQQTPPNASKAGFCGRSSQLELRPRQGDIITTLRIWKVVVDKSRVYTPAMAYPTSIEATTRPAYLKAKKRKSRPSDARAKALREAVKPKR